MRPTMLLVASLGLLAATGSSAASAQATGVSVTEAWSRASAGAAQTGAVYVTVTAAVPDRLTAASTSAAASVELHQTRMAGAVMEMRPVPDGLAVGPGTPIHMVPGGYHLMLLGLKQPLRQGEHVPVTLVFEHAGAVAVEAVIAGPGASGPPSR